MSSQPDHDMSAIDLHSTPSIPSLPRLEEFQTAAEHLAVSTEQLSKDVELAFASANAFIAQAGNGSPKAIELANLAIDNALNHLDDAISKSFSRKRPRDEEDRFPFYSPANIDISTIFQHQDESHLKEWLKESEVSAIIRPLNFTDKPSNDDYVFARSKLRNAIQEILSDDASNILVSPPLPKQNDRRAKTNTQGPQYFLVSGIPANRLENFVHHAFYSTSHMSFTVLSLPPTPTGFIGIVDGCFSLDGDHAGDVLALLRELITSKLAKPIANFVKRHVPNRLAITSLDQQIQDLLPSFRVEQVEVGLREDQVKTVYKIFGPVLFNDAKTHNDWRNIFNKAEIRTVKYGCGVIELNKYKCTRCHAIDHPDGLCPLYSPDMVAWKAAQSFRRPFNPNKRFR